MNHRLSSLELVATEVQSELEQQLRHFEGLDTKAGIVLGFAGVLVALSGKVEPLLGPIGLGLAAVAALMAVWAFLPRRFPVLDLGQLREGYLTAQPEFTTLHLMDTRLEMWRLGSQILAGKALRLKVALLLIALATAALAGSILLNAPGV